MKKIKYKLVFCLLVIVLLSVFVSTPVMAQEACPDGELCNPLGKTTTFQTLIGSVINEVLGVVGSIALLMFIYGGFTWMTAAGNEQKVAKGKEILVWATIGLTVIFSSYALVKFVFTGLGA